MHELVEAGVPRVIDCSVSVRQEAVRVVMAVVVCATSSNAYAGFECKGLEKADDSCGQVVAGAQKHYRVVALRPGHHMELSSSAGPAPKSSIAGGRHIRTH